MSAFQHNPEHFLAVFAALASHTRTFAHGSMRSLALEHIPLSYYPAPNPKEVRETQEERAIWSWLSALYLAEAAAVAGRYRQPAGTDTLGPMPAPEKPALIPVAVYKALQSVRYQCAEEGSEDVEPHKSALVALDALLVALAKAIVERLPEYELAEWAIV